MSVLLMALAAIAQIKSTADPLPRGYHQIPGNAVIYQRWKIGRTDGYSEKQMSPGRWRMDAHITSGHIKDLGLMTVLYRSAIITKASGYNRFFTTNLEVHYRVRNFYVGGEQIYSKFAMHSNAAAPPACEAMRKWAGNCRDHDADEVIATIGPMLGQDSSAAAAEIQDARRQYFAAAPGR